jgi:hypothetical protein
VVGGSVPKEFIKPIDQGIKEAMEGGILAGYEMVDVKAILYDGSYHDVDSNEMAFKIAGSMAFKEAARRASPVLLEPVMAVEVVTPEDYAGTIMGDLSSRRGRIEGMEHRAGSQVIKAIVPLAEMFGYATHMRSSTQGRAEYSMHFARYEEAPRSVSEEIIARVQGTQPSDCTPRGSWWIEDSLSADGRRSEFEAAFGLGGLLRSKLLSRVPMVTSADGSLVQSCRCRAQYRVRDFWSWHRGVLEVFCARLLG